MMNFAPKKGKGRKAKAGSPGGAVSGAPLQENGGAEEASSQLRKVKRKILVVGKSYAFTNGVIEYAANLSQRLGYDIIAMNVNPALALSGTFFSPYNQHLRGKFTQRAREAWSKVETELAGQGICAEHVVKFEDLVRSIKDLNYEVKRIDFVITDAGIRDEEITGEITLPVFSISGYQGEQVMANETHEKMSRGKLLGRTAVLGVASAALYAAVFTHTGTVMKYFTKGGIYAALPIITVFVFSFVHGAFTSNLWSVLGIEATKKVQPRVAPKRPAPRKRPRPRVQLNA
ncbi:MAG TPA: hypothetical protein VE082_05175 [Desulfobaccales bacterium]|nr:hypothetical protein [Desulfobaccales bacterium]